MKSQKFILAVIVAVGTAMNVPTGLAAQEAAAPAKKAQHHHYKLIILGTLGGPQSYGDAGHGAANITNQGVVAGAADTAALDPFYPNYNPLFSALIGSYPYIYHAFTSTGGALVDLGGLGGYSSVPTHMTETGLVSGGSLDGTIDPFTGWPAAKAVLWANGYITNMGTLGGYESQALFANSHGQVTGFATNAIPDPLSILYWWFYSFPNGTQTRAFLWDAKNEMQDLGTLGGPDAFATQINERGQIAGFSYTSFTPNQTTGVPTIDPFLWQNGKMIDLGSLGGTIGMPNGINNRGQVIGQSNPAGDVASHAFLWDSGKLRDIGTLGGIFGSANTLNEAGDVVGQASTATGELHAFFWRHGVITDLGPVPGFADTTCIGAFGINSHDQVVGQAMYNFCDGSQAQAAHAFLWENGDMIDLNTFVPKGTDITLNEVEQITDRGEMFGIGTLSDGNYRAFFLIPCDDSHPNLEGCDYSMLESAEIANNAAALQTPRVVPPAMDSLSRTINPSQNWFRQRYRMFGQRPPLSH